ncbi:MAG TPA: methanogenesis marker 5 protein [Methanoregulaceae archaeon]|jgi:putative methanogenesis marker protein 5|nr:methanogenesis marker 5 protein [Methanolinea sp.]MCC7566599.1 methanogenesis marker 5 protein [Methanoregulaceae archaeon]MDD3091280.1 methanogenesis marker 5 protein [Methanoregulaceae archaeon]MDD5049708.1 methanogenesis marker 5 protein [Methanoregulaceae archaeon]MDD5685535.1 methanogenesis marker 5 protein [Methanoregulaceae archaeon]
MAKVFIYPATSLILSDLVARFGHTPLSAAIQIRERIQTPGLDSPPLQITPEEPKKGLKYAAVEVPSGVRGRMSLYGPMIEEAEAAIIINDADYAFGCMGCARTNELIKFLVRSSDIPVLDLNYPKNEEEGEEFVAAIHAFLKRLEESR